MKEGATKDSIMKEGATKDSIMKEGKNDKGRVVNER